MTGPEPPLHGRDKQGLLPATTQAIPKVYLRQGCPLVEDDVGERISSLQEGGGSYDLLLDGA